ncbi:MAG: Ig-like domain-containing protein [Pyrinomonadaceae bacterium]|nr:Ig-like domain-containing protein [Pyrinomonadaceae bacterium]
MTQQIPSSNRNGRTFVATLLAYVLLTSQLAPMAMAFNGSANRRASAKSANVEVEKGEASPQEGIASSFAPVPVPLRVTATGLAPIISATKVDSFPDVDGDGKVSPGQNITYTVTLTNTGPDPALNLTLNDTVDPNTTLVPGSAVATPIAFNDAYNVIGNVRIQPNAAQGLLANDINPNTGNNTGLTASGGTTSTQGGNVAINSDGSFSYDPPVGFTGSDTFTYTATSANGVDTRTVTLTVAGMIFFVNDDDPVAGGDGRLTNPFNCLVGAGCFSASTADEAGDNIFLLNGAYTGGLTFLANQKLIGQGATDTLANIAGVGAVQPYSDPLPVTNGNPANVTITTAIAATNALTVNAGGIILRGFTIGNTTGAKILGSSFGTLTAGNNASPDLVLNGTGQALNLTTGTFAATSAFLSVATASSGTQGISFSGVAGTVSFGSTNIAGSTTQGILVGTTTADINFGNTSVSGGTDGVSLQNNASGTRTFGSLSVSNNSGIGFLHAVGGGNVNVTGATLIPAAAQTAPVGTGIDIQSLATGTTVTFAATTVNKGNAGIGVNLGSAATANVGNVTFNSLAITTSNGAGLVGAGNTGQTNVTTSAGSIAATGGPAINITKAAAPASPITLNFTAASSTNSAAQGINIDRVSGNMTTASTSITNPTGAGIQVQNTSVGGTMNFGNTTNNQAGGTGVLLAGNAGAITFVTLQVTPDSGQRGLLAQNNTGTISSTNGAINATNAVNMEITGASAAARTPLSMTLDDIVSTNSTTLGVVLNFVSGNLTVTGAGTDTDIQNPTGIGIQVLNSGAGTLNFGDTVVNASGGTGVVLGTAANGNTGALTFTDLDITPDSGQRALHAIQNTGAITTTSGTITTTNNTAIEIVGTSSASRTPLNTQWTTVNTTGGGAAANGIRLVNTSVTGAPGGFRVLGTGGTCNAATPTCTGGRITNTAGADNSGAAPAGTGVSLDNAATVVLTSMRIDTHPNYGIRGTLVSAFTLSNSLVATNGTNQNGPFTESSISFLELTGTCLITTSEVSGGFAKNIGIDNTTGTLDLTVSSCNIHNTGNAAGDDGLFIELGDPAAPAAVGTLHVTNNTFSAHGGDHFDLSLFGSPTASLVFTGNAGSPGSPVHPIGLGQNFRVLGASFGGTFTYDVSTNTVNGSRQGHAIMVNKGSGTGTFSGRISGNTIGLAGVTLSGASESNGISVESRGGGSHTTLVTNNTIRQYRDIGINIEGAEAGTTTFNATITGNTIDEPGSPGAAGLSLHGIQLNWGIDVGNTSVACVDIGGSTPALRNNAPNSGNEAAGGADIRPRQRQLTTVRLPGYTGANNDNAAVATYLSGRNTVTSVVSSNTVATGGGGFLNSSPANSPCTQPTIPTAPEKGSEEKPGSGDDLVSPAPAVQTTAPSSTDSITSRPFISSPRTQAVAVAKKPVVQSPAVNTVVVDPGVRYRPKPRPVAPPAGDGLPTPPVIVGDNLTWNVGTLPAGQSVTITFQVVVDDPFMGAMPQVSNQGTVTADGGISVLTDDPSVGGMNDPTVTLVTVPPDLFVRDASVAEPAAGSTPMIFTLALSTPAPTGGIVVNLSTANGTATGGTCAGGADYESVTGGTTTFAAGEQIKTFPVTVCSDATAEGDETFTLNVNSAPGAVIVDGTGTGTITLNQPGTILISEMRTSGPAGAGDDFVEIYNNTDTPHTVPAGGYGLFKMGADCNAVPVLIGTIPATTVIPQRGHYLFVGSTYSLANYGGTGAAAGNATLTTDIEGDFNVGLFMTVDPLQVSSANRLDAVGFGANTSGVCALLLEGTTLAPASGSTSEYSFVREFTLVSNDVPTPTDGNDNAADFTVISTTPLTPVGGTAAPRLGAPGPENLAGPNLKKFSQVGSQLIDPLVPQSAAPNRARDTTPDPANNSTLGTLASRRTFINNTAGAITRLRFRIYDITTFPSPVGTADLRARTSSNVVVTVTGGTMLTALATTLEAPPAQPNSGGLNSSLAAGTVTLGTPLAAGASIHLNFLFGVQQSGSFRVFVFVEAVP